MSRATHISLIYFCMYIRECTCSKACHEYSLECTSSLAYKIFRIPVIGHLHCNYTVLLEVKKVLYNEQRISCNIYCQSICIFYFYTFIYLRWKQSWTLFIQDNLSKGNVQLESLQKRLTLPDKYLMDISMYIQPKLGGVVNLLYFVTWLWRHHVIPVKE